MLLFGFVLCFFYTFVTNTDQKMSKQRIIAATNLADVLKELLSEVSHDRLFVLADEQTA
jgi:hypothetical protein